MLDGKGNDESETLSRQILSNLNRKKVEQEKEEKLQQMSV